MGCSVFNDDKSQGVTLESVTEEEKVKQLRCHNTGETTYTKMDGLTGFGFMVSFLILQAFWWNLIWLFPLLSYVEVHIDWLEFTLSCNVHLAPWFVYEGNNIKPYSYSRRASWPHVVSGSRQVQRSPVGLGTSRDLLWGSLIPTYSTSWRFLTLLYLWESTSRMFIFWSFWVLMFSRNVGDEEHLGGNWDLMLSVLYFSLIAEVILNEGGSHFRRNWDCWLRRRGQKAAEVPSVGKTRLQGCRVLAVHLLLSSGKEMSRSWKIPGSVHSMTVQVVFATSKWPRI